MHDHLARRGIDPRILQDLHITETTIHARPALRVPFYGHDGVMAGVKAIFLDGHTPKAVWTEKIHPHFSHCLFGWQSLVSGKEYLILEGEKDALLGMTLSGSAVSGSCGAGTPYSSYALEGLTRLHVGRGLMIYDNDAAGREGMTKNTWALRGSRLSCTAYSLPATVGDHGDFTDLYASCGQDPQVFFSHLHDLPSFAVKEQPSRSPVLPRREVQDSHRSTFNATHDLASLVASYGVTLQRDGSLLKGCCPFHQEDTPSFKVYSDHYHCYGCLDSGDAYWFHYRMEGHSGACTHYKR